MKRLLHPLPFLLRCACTFSLVWLTFLSTPASAHRDASKHTHNVPASKQSPGDTRVYTDKRQFLHSRLKRLRAIVQRAKTAQQRLRRRALQRNTQPDPQTLKKWHDIEKSARTMMVQIDNALSALPPGSPRQPAAPPQPPTKPRRPMAKDVVLTRLDGKRERMSTHRGDVVLLHFWAIWCRPCVKEMPTLNRLHRQLQSESFAVVAVNLDARKKDVRRFLRKKNLRMPVYLDPGRTLYQQIFGSPELLPRSLLIDKTGRIVRSYAGAQHLKSPQTFADIQQLLASPG
ncbi:MAG: TlpA family protein disulfide reductase [Candidatus Tectomicrobia bacterium]|nr:TlpA family protein disulfide reductase [Candidatus Tectomicrobia bacterium]